MDKTKYLANKQEMESAVAKLKNVDFAIFSPEERAKFKTEFTELIQEIEASNEQRKAATN